MAPHEPAGERHSARAPSSSASRRSAALLHTRMPSTTPPIPHGQDRATPSTCRLRVRDVLEGPSRQHDRDDDASSKKRRATTVVVTKLRAAGRNRAAIAAVPRSRIVFFCAAPRVAFMAKHRGSSSEAPRPPRIAQRRDRRQVLGGSSQSGRRNASRPNTYSRCVLIGRRACCDHEAPRPRIKRDRALYSANVVSRSLTTPRRHVHQRRVDTSTNIAAASISDSRGFPLPPVSPGSLLIHEMSPP